jgi:hypothetical protein
VVSGNSDARSFYERRGLVPYLIRLYGRIAR